jgi:Protein of unknown function, DUF600
MENAYQVLAAILSSNCPDGFQNASIQARLADDFSQMQYWCEVSGKKIQPSIPSMQKSDVDDALHEIRKQMTIPGEQPWSRCTFTLFPDGKFKFDVEYDD